MRLTLVLAVALTSALVGCTPGIGQPTPTTTSSSRPPRVDGFQVVDISVRAEPFRITTACPATITFTARIKVEGGKGRVVYHWLGSDGAQTDAETLEFDGSGDTKDVVTAFTTGEPGKIEQGWQKVVIAQPRPQESEVANFTLTCTN